VPFAALKGCRAPGCRGLTRGRFCAAHAQDEAAPDDRPSASQRGYDASWRAQRRAFLETHPVCRICGACAAHVDHITPLAAGGALAERNLQALCASCHSRKTAARDGGFGNARA